MSAEQIQLLIPTLITHTATFIVFLWLLNKFATGPVLQILDERRKKIADKFDEIDKSEKHVAGLREEYEAKLRDIEDKAHERMQEEVNRGRGIAEEIADKARTEAGEIVEGARENVQVQIRQAREELKDEVVQMTLTATEKLLRERLDDEKQREMVQMFVNELAQKN